MENHNTCKNGDDQGIDIVLPTLSPYDKLRPISSGLHMDPMSYWDLRGLSTLEWIKTVAQEVYCLEDVYIFSTYKNQDTESVDLCIVLVVRQKGSVLPNQSFSSQAWDIIGYRSSFQFSILGDIKKTPGALPFKQSEICQSRDKLRASPVVMLVILAIEFKRYFIGFKFKGKSTGDHGCSNEQKGGTSGKCSLQSND